MLTKRIIPCLDVKDGRVVKGVSFVNLKDAGDPAGIAKAYDEQGADELCFLDITASYEKRNIIIDVVMRVAEQVFMPLTVGGGIRILEDIRDLLKAGADKVSINTAAVEDPEFVRRAAERFGTQCIVVAIDAKQVQQSVVSSQNNPPLPPFTKGGVGGITNSELSWKVYTYGGRTPTHLDAIEWAKKVERLGAGEILLTSMDMDGTKEGYDIELTRKISEAVNIPVIASGGAGNLEHLHQGLVEGKADAVLVASIFHYKEYTIREAKEYLKARGVTVRL